MAWQPPPPPHQQQQHDQHTPMYHYHPETSHHDEPKHIQANNGRPTPRRSLSIATMNYLQPRPSILDPPHHQVNAPHSQNYGANSATPSPLPSPLFETDESRRSCDDIWSHSEHRDLSRRYTKVLEDLSATRSDVIRLTNELASAQTRLSSLQIATPFPSAPPSPALVGFHLPPPPARSFSTSAVPSPPSIPSPNDPFAAMKMSMAMSSSSKAPPLSRRESSLPTPPEQSNSHSPASTSGSRSATAGRTKYYNAPTLPSCPPEPSVINRYLLEVENWTRPRYESYQLANVHNYLNETAVKSNLRTEMVDLGGTCPSPAEWKSWIAERLAVVRDLLDQGKTWKNQRVEDKRLAVQVIEKRCPALALCEPDRCWKAVIFLQRRLDEAIKMNHETERRKEAKSAENSMGASPIGGHVFSNTTETSFDSMEGFF